MVMAALTGLIPITVAGGVAMEFAKQLPCPTPGRKIRSRGMGRGLARGRGRGPIGVPIGRKIRPRRTGIGFGNFSNIGL